MRSLSVLGLDLRAESLAHQSTLHRDGFRHWTVLRHGASAGTGVRRSLCRRAPQGQFTLSISLIFVTNPLTMPVIYYAAYELGAFLLDTPLQDIEFEITWSWLSQRLGDIWQPFLLGCFVIVIWADGLYRHQPAVALASQSCLAAAQPVEATPAAVVTVDCWPGRWPRARG